MQKNLNTQSFFAGTSATIWLVATKKKSLTFLRCCQRSTYCALGALLRDNL